MFRRLILITIILSYVTANKNCVLYVLDSELTQATSLVNCDSGANWQIVNLKKKNVPPRSQDTINALLASSGSCVKLKIGFLSKGTLEAEVYASSPSCLVNIGIDDTVINNRSPLSSTQINPADKTLDLGWRKLTVDIDKDIENALITLRGTCTNGYVLVASFKHIPLGSSKQDCKTFLKQNLSNFKGTVLTHKERDIPELSFNVNYKSEDMDVVITHVLRNDEEATFWTWTPLTISLITLSVVIVLLILAITAYQCGKSKGLDEVSTIYWNDNDRTLTIPRARSIYSQSISRSQRSQRDSGQFP